MYTIALSQNVDIRRGLNCLILFYFCTVCCLMMLLCLVQEPFPSVREAKIHRPVVGDSLTLQCQPPYGYPPGIVYWGEFKSGEKLKPIENTARVSLDYNGT